MTRPTRRATYAEYLNSPQWKRLRKQALTRDGHKCRGCGDPAWHVHHDRYPTTYGQEKLSWLYSLCADCHTAIHAIEHSGVKLKSATRQVVVATNDPVARKRKQKRTKKRKVTHNDVVRLKQRLENPGVGARRAFEMSIEKENDRTHQILQANKRRREANRISSP